MRYLETTLSVGMTCAVVAVVLGSGCQPFEDPVEAVCTQIDVVPESAVLPATGAGQTWIDLAVCHCPDSAEAQPCPDEALMQGRYLHLATDRGTLQDDTMFLRTGRAETLLTSSDVQEVATVTAWTGDGWSGSAAVQFYGPLGLGDEAVSFEVGESRQVEVTGAVFPLADPVVTGDAPLTATFDGGTSLLLLSAHGDVAEETLGSVTVEDALGQLASVAVTLLPGPLGSSDIDLNAENEELEATGLDYTWITVAAADLVDGTTVTLSATMGTLHSSSLVLQDGTAQTLFFAGTTPGTALLLAFVGDTVSDPEYIDIIAAEDPAEDE